MKVKKPKDRKQLKRKAKRCQHCGKTPCEGACALSRLIPIG